MFILSLGLRFDAYFEFEFAFECVGLGLGLHLGSFFLVWVCSWIFLFGGWGCILIFSLRLSLHSGCWF